MSLFSFRSPWQTIDGFLRMAQRTPNFVYRSIACALSFFLVGHIAVKDLPMSSTVSLTFAFKPDPLIAAAIYGTTFPAKPSTPLLPPPDGKKWPLVIFSHGVGCSRLMYSTFCGEMASQGYIVCGIEHRDGTSPCSTIVSEDGKAKTLNWLQWSDL